MTTPRTDLAVWGAAVNAALLGTDRAPLGVPASDGALGAACARVARDDPERAAALLRVAAAAGAYRRCGRGAARTADAVPAACPPEERPLCPPAATGLLRRMLQGERSEERRGGKECRTR